MNICHVKTCAANSKIFASLCVYSVLHRWKKDDGYNREEDEQTTDTNVFQQSIHTKIHFAKHTYVDVNIPSTLIPGGGVIILSKIVTPTLSLPIWRPPGPVGKLSPLESATLKLSPSSDRLSSTAENGKQTGLVELRCSCPFWTVIGEKSSTGIILGIRFFCVAI